MSATVDVRTPISNTTVFASAIAGQSRKAFLRLTHAHPYAELLPGGAGTGAAIESVVHHSVTSLKDLQKLLENILVIAEERELARLLHQRQEHSGAHQHYCPQQQHPQQQSASLNHVQGDEQEERPCGESAADANGSGSPPYPTAASTAVHASRVASDDQAGNDSAHEENDSGKAATPIRPPPRTETEKEASTENLPRSFSHSWLGASQRLSHQQKQQQQAQKDSALNRSEVISVDPAAASPPPLPPLSASVRLRQVPKLVQDAFLRSPEEIEEEAIASAALAAASGYGARATVPFSSSPLLPYSQQRLWRRTHHTSASVSNEVSRANFNNASSALMGGSVMRHRDDEAAGGGEEEQEESIPALLWARSPAVLHRWYDAASATIAGVGASAGPGAGNNSGSSGGVSALLAGARAFLNDAGKRLQFEKVREQLASAGLLPSAPPSPTRAAAAATDDTADDDPHDNHKVSVSGNRDLLEDSDSDDDAAHEETHSPRRGEEHCMPNVVSEGELEACASPPLLLATPTATTTVPDWRDVDGAHARSADDAVGAGATTYQRYNTSADTKDSVAADKGAFSSSNGRPLPGVAAAADGRSVTTPAFSTTTMPGGTLPSPRVALSLRLPTMDGFDEGSVTSTAGETHELLGWLHLLVWVRVCIVQTLKELSLAQGAVAWSAWYWTWALEHPRQATFHQSLSGLRFWRRLLRLPGGGFEATVRATQYEANSHMFTLKNLFRYLVSCIGACYGVLERLNTSVGLLRRACDANCSHVAAAAAAISHSNPTHLTRVPLPTPGASVSVGAVPPPPPPLNSANVVNAPPSPGVPVSLLSRGNSMFPTPGSPVFFEGGGAANIPFSFENLSTAATDANSQRRPPDGSSFAATLAGGGAAADGASHASAWGSSYPADANETSSPSIQAAGSPTFTSAGGLPEATAAATGDASAYPATTGATAVKALRAVVVQTLRESVKLFSADLYNEGGPWMPAAGAAAAGDGATTAATATAGGGVEYYDATTATAHAPTFASNSTRLWGPFLAKAATGSSNERASGGVAAGGGGMPPRVSSRLSAFFRSAEDSSSATATATGASASAPYAHVPHGAGNHPIGSSAGNILGSRAGTTATTSGSSSNSNTSEPNDDDGSGSVGGPATSGGAGGGLAGDDMTLQEAVAVLLAVSRRASRLSESVEETVMAHHRPPLARHWRRILVALTLTVPPLVWLYPKNPREVAELARGAARVIGNVVYNYALLPLQQIKEAIFYVRPGVEERRRNFDRDAEALAKIIRDYHEHCYPNLSQDRLDQLQQHSFQCLRSGTADSEGFGLVERQYRLAVKHPYWSAIFGDLPRILLIQMSYQALEVNRVTNGIDEVLEGNDLNFKVMALVPVLAVAGLSLTWGFFVFRARHLPARHRMKLLWRSVYRVVTLADERLRRAAAASAGGPSHSHVPHPTPPLPPPPFHPQYQQHSYACGSPAMPPGRAQPALRRQLPRLSAAPGHAAGADHAFPDTPAPTAAATAGGGPTNTATATPNTAASTTAAASDTNAAIVGVNPNVSTSGSDQLMPRTTTDIMTTAETPITTAMSGTIPPQPASALGRTLHSEGSITTNIGVAGGDGGGDTAERPVEDSNNNSPSPDMRATLGPAEVEAHQRPKQVKEGDDSQRLTGAKSPVYRSVSFYEGTGDTSSELHHHHHQHQHNSHDTYNIREQPYLQQQQQQLQRQFTYSGGGGAGVPYPPPPHYCYQQQQQQQQQEWQAQQVQRGPRVDTLNNYEQGMVLILVHIMRSLGETYLRGHYPYYSAFMEDLDDLECVQCTCRERLDILYRMQVTHFFF